VGTVVAVVVVVVVVPKSLFEILFSVQATNKQDNTTRPIAKQTIVIIVDFFINNSP
jgi:hypothetical protein